MPASRSEAAGQPHRIFALALDDQLRAALVGRRRVVDARHLHQ